MQQILLTGGSGKVASLLRPLMARNGRTLRLLDLVAPTRLNGTGAEDVILGSLTDVETVQRACQDIDAIIHLGGQSLEAPLVTVLEHNVVAAIRMLEAARTSGVRRVILASSSHAVGFHSRTSSPLPADAPPRPDTLYGWSKVAVEMAGRLFHDRYGMEIICLRIGSWVPQPTDLRGLAMWLSPADGHRLIEACLSYPNPGFRTVWAISRNTRRWVSLSEGEAIGYHPQDDAEIFAERLVSAHGQPDFGEDPVLARLGGQWCTIPLGSRSAPDTSTTQQRFVSVQHD